MKKFDVPSFYKSSFVSKIKDMRKDLDPRKKDYLPSILDFGPVKFYMARHFGFCFGVENAIEIAYRAIDENPGKKIYLLSEMIHNPQVNEDLLSRGVRFIMDTKGNQLISWDSLDSSDVIILPAFGTTIEIEEKISEIGLDTFKYNTTCPFVERVWKMSSKLGDGDYTIIIHGKHYHEETRATFSHASKESPSLILRDLEEAKVLNEVIQGIRPKSDFYDFFKDKYSMGFDVDKDLQRIGVVNQTTMLATETSEIASYIRSCMKEKFGDDRVKEHFADTRDSLCYATNDNQRATNELLNTNADFAIVVGGYNSSNTSHIVSLCKTKFPTFFISGPEKIELNSNVISHFDVELKKELNTHGFLPKDKDIVNIVLTSGASCPDALVESVMQKFTSYYDECIDYKQVLENIEFNL